MRSKVRKKISYSCYRMIRGLVWLCYPKMTLRGTENIPQEPCIFVANHTQMNGPICAQLYFPGKRKIWCAHQMMHMKEVPDYAFDDFWSQKPKKVRWLYRLLSYLIAPVSACVFQNADTIAVYHDNRLLSTFKQSIAALEDGYHIVIFPEGRQEHNHVVNLFQERFVDTAKLYYKRTGKAVSFVPVYIAPSRKEICFGKKVCFDPGAQMDEERRRICDYLMEAITQTAKSLPLHKVVPYSNISRREYPNNICDERVEL